MENQNLKELIVNLEKELLRLGYSEGSMTFYKRRWQQLLAFAKEQGVTHYSERLGIDFIEQCFNILEKDFVGTLKQYEVQNLRVIRMVGDFQLHGTVLRRYYKHKELLHNPYFIEVINDFKQYCINKDYSTATIEHYTKQSSRFLDYADSQSISSCGDISLTLINRYIKTLAGYTYKTVEQQLCSLRALFKYLFKDDLIVTDFSQKIPMVQSRKKTRIPSVWSVSDLKKLIAAIDRGSPVGKRDYAMILLACHLGLRVSDIKKLTFENFHWEDKQLVFTQSKTRTSLSLPLEQEVGWAVIDYLKYGRPDINSPYLFIRHLAPFLPFSENDHLHQIIIKYMHLAHIPVSPKKRVGMHSLRHTLASLLLENNTPLPVISNILGHLDVESSAVYLKVDIKKLKECPLDLKEGSHDE
ncbi:MAG: tyrosine-type recombinase/integrase [Methyloprofundus sp.]|nr:tyrosine-type recombinase/integrase [Methyloprofundus sp.]